MPKIKEERAQLPSGDNVSMTIMIPRASKEKLEKLCQINQEYAKKTMKLKPSSKSLMIYKLIERDYVRSQQKNQEELVDVLKTL